MFMQSWKEGAAMSDPLFKKEFLESKSWLKVQKD